MHKIIYLDHAATTPVDKKVMKAMLPYFASKYGNGSSFHSLGREAFEAVEAARGITADFFGAEKDEIIFTSGATEANNLAIKGIVKAYYASNLKGKKPHIITTAFEHHCVLHAVESLQAEGLISADFIRPKSDGVIDVKDIERTIRPETILISIMYVNNEIGTVQPIAEIGKIIKKLNEANKLKAKSYKLFFHTDATQAVNYFDCDIQKLGVDLLSLSAHKIYGPKGVGALVIKKGTPIKAVQDGGGQERALRSGTLNSPGIVGLGEAIRNIKSQKSKIKRMTSLRDYFIGRILKEIPNTILNGSKEKRSPNNVNVSFKDAEGESLIMMLDSEGIACSTGSACSSGSLSPSHVLLSIGRRPEEAHGSLRFTLGKDTTKKEIDVAFKKLKGIVEKLRKISGSVLSDYFKARNTKHENRNNIKN